jgi:hypothetical protein
MHHGYLAFPAFLKIYYRPYKCLAGCVGDGEQTCLVAQGSLSADLQLPQLPTAQIDDDCVFDALPSLCHVFASITTFGSKDLRQTNSTR